jgi:hypothetical protein
MVDVGEKAVVELPPFPDTVALKPERPNVV